MIRLDAPVIVEGKYDKITLSNVLDALIIPTDGFRIFKDKEKCALIRTLAKKYGVIVMTDSDSAGAVIRSYLKQVVGDAQIIQVYMPKISGKEKRKNRPSKEGLLGVEGMTPRQIEETLNRYGVFSKSDKTGEPITKTDLYVAGLTGNPSAGSNRKDFLAYLDLPDNLTTPALLDVLTRIYTRDEFECLVKEWKNNRQKSL